VTTAEGCDEFNERLRTWPNHRRGMREWLQGLSAIESCVAEGLCQTRQAEDWPMFERYAFAAFYHPSRAHTSALCEVLSRRNDDVNNEDLVDALAEIADPSSVDCLRDAFRWRPPWDEFGQLARKAVWALRAIDTPEALAVIREAADDEREKPREAAVRELRRRGGQDAP
jgi:PBS lyase HEAT-like repeat